MYSPRKILKISKTIVLKNRNDIILKNRNKYLQLMIFLHIFIYHLMVNEDDLIMHHKKEPLTFKHLLLNHERNKN